MTKTNDQVPLKDRGTLTAVYRPQVHCAPRDFIIDQSAMQGIGRNLILLREQHGTLPKEVAGSLRISQSLLHTIEQGEYPFLNLPTLDAFARYYQVRTMDILATNENTADSKARADRFRTELQAVGKTLQNVRSSAGISRKVVALAVGITPTRLANIEAGQDDAVSMMLLMKLARHYKISPVDLLGDVPGDKFI